MSETTPPSEPATGPVTTTSTTSQPAITPPPPVEREPLRRRGRLNLVAAWVGIVAGVVFIVAVIFFSGFVLGAHSGGGHHGWRHHGGGHRDNAMMHRGGPPAMFPMMPRGQFERPGQGFGPPFGGPGGPGGAGAEQPQGPGAPSTSDPARP